MTINISSYFQHRWSVFWATTYTFEPQLFDEFWFPRLGDAPLNATLLVDASRLAATWAALPADEPWRMKRANRQYLIRGVPRAHAFHPKTYFFANTKEGVLLVGSGNLGLRGLEDGQELFSVFASDNEAGLDAIRGWRDWMEQVVKQLDDHDVARRWLDLIARTPWLAGAAAKSAFVTNWERNLHSQFVEGVTAPVDELHVLAPFHDPDATALEALIVSTQPQRLHLYIGKDTSVNGSKLRDVVEHSAAEVVLSTFEPEQFVHAKLIGAIKGDTGSLLSGSANLSRVALLNSAATGNVEAGVLLDMRAATVRAMFTPPGLALRTLSMADLVALRFRHSPEGVAPPLTLLSARRLPDQRVEVRVRGEPPSGQLMLADGHSTKGLDGDRTSAPFPLAGEAALVWISDAHGQAVSNRVPLDDPESLTRWLQQQRVSGEDRPRELEARDEASPIGEMLQRLHRACIFDIDETPAAARTQRLQESDADPTFWERLLKDELHLDPRAIAYIPRTGTAGLDEDDVLVRLRQMLNEAPRQRELRLLKPIPENTPGQGGSGTPWTPDRRQQLRLYNVLDRWSRALSDPRLCWVNPIAPVRNYTALVSALLECWIEQFLSEERLIRLSGTLFSSFVRSERSLGYLMALAAEERAVATAAVDDEARPAAAALAYAALRLAAPWRDYIFEWQAFLVPMLETGVIRADGESAELVALITGQETSPSTVATRLEWAATYLDDRRWGEITARELDLARVELTHEKFNPDFGVSLNVSAVQDPLGDPRMVTLVRKALEYRKATGVVVTLPSGRIAVRVGDVAYAQIQGLMYESTQTITLDQLRLLDSNGANLSALLVPSSERAV